MENREGELRMKIKNLILGCHPENKKFLVLIALVLLTLQSCGKREKAIGTTDDISLGSIIVGDLDWQEITTLSPTSPIFENSSFVGDVDLPAVRSRCTGFLISEDVFMTNEHCVGSASDAVGLTVAFNHVLGVPEADYDVYDCSEFIGNNSTLDFALVRCQGSPGAQLGFADLSEQSFGVGEALYIIQQNCDYYTDRSCDHNKKFSEGRITKVDDEYTHNADTLGGSSGSPVFSKATNQVIAIHHAGLGNNGQGRGVENYAVPMDKIVRHIQANFPGILGASSGSGSGSGGGSQNPPDDSPEEPNDSFQDAFALHSGPESHDFKIDSASDEDFFKFTLSAAGEVAVKIAFVHSTGDLDMKLYDASFNQLKVSQSVANQEQFNEELSAGTYYLKVYGYQGATNDYALSFQSSSSAPAPQQPNNSFDNAYNVFQESSGEITGAGEKDYFFFDVQSEGNVSVKMQIDSSAGDLDLELYDSSFQRVGYSIGVTKSEQITKSLAPGRYYVLVRGYRDATGGYELTVE